MHKSPPNFVLSKKGYKGGLIQVKIRNKSITTERVIIWMVVPPFLHRCVKLSRQLGVVAVVVRDGREQK